MNTANSCLDCIIVWFRSDDSISLDAQSDAGTGASRRNDGSPQPAPFAPLADDQGLCLLLLPSPSPEELNACALRPTRHRNPRGAASGAFFVAVAGWRAIALAFGSDARAGWLAAVWFLYRTVLHLYPPCNIEVKTMKYKVKSL
jgi:hypothetical protein